MPVTCQVRRLGKSLFPSVRLSQMGGWWPLSSADVPEHHAQSRGPCSQLHSALFALPTGKKRNSKNSANSGSGFWGALTYAAVGGGGSGGPRVWEGGAGPGRGRCLTTSSSPGLLTLGLPALGFTSTGILANSVASSLMSWSAVASGGGVPAGGLVATLQSLGESGWALGGVGETPGPRGPLYCSESFSQAN